MAGGRSGSGKGKRTSTSRGHSQSKDRSQDSSSNKGANQKPKSSKATERQELRRDRVLEKLCAQSQSRAVDSQEPLGDN